MDQIITPRHHKLYIPHDKLIILDFDRDHPFQAKIQRVNEQVKEIVMGCVKL